MSRRSNVFGLILAGGSGSRLWPMSREMYPKQLLKLSGDKTLFQSTFLRLSNTINSENIVTVTNVKHATDIKMQLSEVKGLLNTKNDFNVIVEPVGKNTAPAIGLSAFYIRELAKDEDPIIVVAPSDHLVKDQEAFSHAIDEAIKLAESGFIVTFGIKPDKPDTGYGYISTMSSTEISDISNKAVKVKEFKEKPDYDTAVQYVKEGSYFWNSGIFVFKASTILNEIEFHCKDIIDVLNSSELCKAGPTIRFDNYNKMPEISIDYAVMEHSNCITLIPIDCGWNDMGSWEAIYDVADKDKHNNFVTGNVIDIDSQNSLIYGTSKLVTTIGLKDTVIVETEDAILACDKSRTQDVKKIFEQLKSHNDITCLVHQTVYRPWGYYTVLKKDKGFLIKIIQVNPGAKLSLQMHYHRSEHWVVLSGSAKVIKGDSEHYLNPGDSIDIPATIKHSLQNPGKLNLSIIEVQRGDYLEEDDIVRFEDLYGRVTSNV